MDTALNALPQAAPVLTRLSLNPDLAYPLPVTTEQQRDELCSLGYRAQD